MWCAISTADWGSVLITLCRKHYFVLFIYFKCMTFKNYYFSLEGSLCVCDLILTFERQPTPVFVPEEFHGQRSLAAYSLWDLKELDTTEWISVCLSVQDALECVCAKSFQPCPTLCDPVACQAPLSVVIPEARILEWVAMLFSRGSSWPRDWTCVSCLLHRQAGSLSLAPPEMPML